MKAHLRAAPIDLPNLPHLQIDKMNHAAAIEHIIKILEEGLSSELHYHAPQHTIDVLQAAELIAQKEALSEKDLALLKVAVAYHDSGFLNTYANHEEAGVQIAENVLPQFNFNDGDIELIANMIRATKIPQQPKSLLEKIICDADLFYLGGNYYYSISHGLYSELKARNPELSKEQWLEMQISFLEQHKYWTDYCKTERQAAKLKILADLKSKRVA